MHAKLAGILLALTLAGCASRPVEVVEVPTPTIPPVQYLQDCVAEYVDVRVNGDMVRKVKSLEFALRKCNADKAALRAWAATLEDRLTKEVVLDFADAK